MASSEENLNRTVLQTSAALEGFITATVAKPEVAELIENSNNPEAGIAIVHVIMGAFELGVKAAAEHATREVRSRLG